MKSKVFIIVLVTVCYFWCIVPGAKGKTFTLSDDDLMSLDSYLYADVNDSNEPKIADKRDVPGPGVEFDIFFPRDNKTNNVVKYVSCEDRGEGVIVDINVHDYNAFALKFTLVAVDGNSEPNTGGILIVGALAGSCYRPESISLIQGESATAVSVTSVSLEKTATIGFDIHKFVPKGWNPEGTTVTVLIEPAPDAEVPP